MNFLKDTIEQALAQLQSDIGKFLQMKAIILGFPAGANRDALLTRQNELEQRAMKDAAEAGAIKEKLPTGIFDAIGKAAQIGDITKKGLELSKEMLRLKADMDEHTANVAALQGMNTGPRASLQAPVAGITPLGAATIGMAVVALTAWAYKRWGK